MKVPLSKRKKYVLLRSAFKRGWRPFMLQAYMTFADTFLRRRHLIYRATAEDVRTRDIPVVPGLEFREVGRWEDLPESSRQRLLDDYDFLTWGDPSWFDKGWRLWIGEFGDKLATLTWWRPPEQCKDFFVELPPGAELIWQTVTMPEFRGRGLTTVQSLNLLKHRIDAGISAFYSCCEDYNTTSARNIPSRGFTMIGHTSQSKITGRRSWHPPELAKKPH